MKLPDSLAFAISTLAEALPDVWVGDQLPPDEELDARLPCVVVDILPGEEIRTAWGGDGFPVRLDRVPLDIEVFGSSRGQIMPVADQVRLLMHQLPHLEGSRVVSVECPAFGSREDLSPRVKVLGVIADLAVHT